MVYSFNTLNILLHFLLACVVSKKLDVIFIFVLLQVKWVFFFSDFFKKFFFLIFDNSYIPAISEPGSAACSVSLKCFFFFSLLVSLVNF